MSALPPESGHSCTRPMQGPPCHLPGPQHPPLAQHANGARGPIWSTKPQFRPLSGEACTTPECLGRVRGQITRHPSLEQNIPKYGGQPLMTPKKLEAQAQPTVFVIDDDPAIRQGVSSLLRSVDICAETFGSPKEFVPEKLPDAPCCLVLDVRFGGLSGLDLQAELDNAGINIPIVFITGHGDIPMSVRAMKAGAVEFLTKPFRDDDLLGAVRVALERDRQQREKNKSLAIIRSCFERLTAREHEVFALVTTGLMNKQIAGQLAISDITVKVHRGNMTRKMGARSFVELVRMADALRLPSSV